MRISILMLTHNRLPVTMRAFQSLESTYGGGWGGADVKWAILDNASTDGMAEWLLKFGGRHPDQFKVFASTVNRGVSGGRKFLLDNAPPCDAGVFLDNDVTISDPNWLAKLIETLSVDHNTGIVGPGGHFVTVDKMGNWEWFEESPPGDCDVVSGFCQAFWWQGVADGRLSIDPAYGQYWLEDSDFCLQAKAAGMKVVSTGPIGLTHHYAGTGDDGSGPAKMRYMASKWQGRGLIRDER